MWLIYNKLIMEKQNKFMKNVIFNLMIIYMTLDIMLKIIKLIIEILMQDNVVILLF